MAGSTEIVKCKQCTIIGNQSDKTELNAVDFSFIFDMHEEVQEEHWENWMGEHWEIIFLYFKTVAIPNFRITVDGRVPA